METRAEGWYPDPWGTDDERWFDGRAWTPRVRAVGAAPTATGFDAVDPAARADAAPTPAVQTPAVPTPAVQTPAAPTPGAARGWFADPWGQATWRWWDGAQWTGYTDRNQAGKVVAGESVAAEVEAERTWARRARVGLALNPVFQVMALVGASIQARWLSSHVDDLANGSRSSGPAATQVLQLLSLPTLGVLLVLVLWLYRAGATARAAGLPMRRSPGLGAVSFIIPILNYWWPYRAVRDALGADGRGSRLVGRWWTAWIAAQLGAFVVLAAGFLPAGFSVVAVGLVAALTIVAAITGRAVVAEVLAAHELLAAREAQAH